jgi:dynein heavy chain
LKYAVCFNSAEDIKLNCNLFYWPASVESIFELSNVRIITKREQLEENLRKRIEDFEEKLEVFNKEIETYSKKEVGFIMFPDCC